MQIKDMNEEKTKDVFNFNKFWGSELLKPHVEYSRKGIHYCIYCGAVANTREHIPSKAFLQKPLPSDLPVLPACQRCNNGFSSDELYTKTYIECLKEVNNNNYGIIEMDSKDRKEVKEAKKSIKRALDEKTIGYDERIGRVLLKLAIGHAVYELSEGYYSFKWSGVPLYVKYLIRSTVSEEAWNDQEYAEVINDEILPDIGSRVFRNIYVVQLPLKKLETKKSQNLNLVMMDWTDIQDGIYRYIAYFKGNKLIVKMIIMDYIYGEVVFEENCPEK